MFNAKMVSLRNFSTIVQAHVLTQDSRPVDMETDRF